MSYFIWFRKTKRIWSASCPILALRLHHHRGRLAHHAAGQPGFLIHTRQGKITGIYCDKPAKILEIETQGDARRMDHQAMPAMISPQTSVKVVGGFGTSVAHMLAMAFDDPSMDAGLRETLAAHEIVIEEEWVDVE